MILAYKQRLQIAKAMKNRGKAIETALRKYNKLAASINPPRPQLTWKVVQQYGYLAEFELLRHGSRDDITAKPWAQESNRQATMCQLRMARAQEEIQRLNIEIRRTLTWMLDDLAHHASVATELNDISPSVARAIQYQHDFRKVTYDQILQHLHKLIGLRGYAGPTTGGINVLATSGVGQDEQENDFGTGEEEEDLAAQHIELTSTIDRMESMCIGGDSHSDQ